MIEDGAALRVQWLPEGRVSRYDAQFLATACAPIRKCCRCERSLWDGATIAAHVPQVDYAA